MIRIKNIELSNFKRFTNLTIQNIPPTSKLVLLIGTNGSGKSSIFDVFALLNRRQYSENYYYYKNSSDEIKGVVSFWDVEKPTSFTSYNNNNNMSLDNPNNTNFIGRPSIRIVPRLNHVHQRHDISKDTDATLHYIDNDTKFLNDFWEFMQRIITATNANLFEGQGIDVDTIYKTWIKPFNESLLKIFDGDATKVIQIKNFSLGNQQEPPKLIFTKGNSTINYDLLSHGEKQVIILILNFVVRKEYYKNCIVFIDEMDCHLNTKLQYNLLKVIVEDWVPDDSQLWTASHSLGFIDYANKENLASIIDFDNFNFDQPQILEPTIKNVRDVYNIAVPKEVLPKIFEYYTIVFAENKNSTDLNGIALENDEQKKFLFLPTNNSSTLFSLIKSQETKYLGLRDRDFLKKNEVEAIQKEYPPFKILKYYCFENYLYHPNNIEELNLECFNKQDYIQDIINQKNKNLSYTISDIKTARMHYSELKDDTLQNKEQDIFSNKEKGNIDEIISDLKSDNLETFYCFFSMKDQYKKDTYLKQFGDIKKQLLCTQWFKTKILEILS